MAENRPAASERSSRPLLQFSPPAPTKEKQHTAVNQPPPPVLLKLQKFTEPPWLDFGRVKVGSSRTLQLLVDNPANSSQYLVLDKLPRGKGFELERHQHDGQQESVRDGGDDGAQLALQLPPNSQQLITVSWTPLEAGTVRELLLFQWDTKQRLQVVLYGTAWIRPLLDTGGSSGNVTGGTKSKLHFDQAGPPRTLQLNRPSKPTPSGAAAAAATPLSRSSSTGSELRQVADQTESAVHLPTNPARPPALPAAASSGSSAALSRSSSSKSNSRPGQLAAPPRLPTRPPSRGSLTDNVPGSDLQQQLSASRLDTSRPPALPRKLASSTGVAPSTLKLRRPTAPHAAEAAPSLSGSDSSLTVSAVAAVAAATPRPAAPPRPPSVASYTARSVQQTPRQELSKSGPSSKRSSFTHYHTGLWMQKQDKAFTAWLNSLLLPCTPDYLRARTEDEQGPGEALAARRLAAQVRGMLWRHYSKNSDIIDVMLKIEKRIDDGRLRLRSEEGLLSDVALREKAMRVLMCYNPFWLRLGMETVVGKAVASAAAAGSGSMMSDAGAEDAAWLEQLQGFAAQHFLGDVDLAAEYCEPTDAVRSAMWVELGKTVLKRFLLLVLLLDTTATSEALPDSAPLLFRLDSSIKSSSAAVREFTHGWLRGEGNTLRHLELTGYRLSYSQSLLNEYPFAVSNLAVDLRDGLRLCRLAELLTGRQAQELLAQARFPADRRPMQVFNVDLALSALQSAGVSLSHIRTGRGLVAVRAEDIVDGDRERSLGLLWQVALQLQLRRIMDLKVLRSEVHRIMARVRSHQAAPRSEAPLQVYLADEFIGLLMEWTQAVCLNYGVQVHNFSSSFADGRVLCLLIAHYLPAYLTEGQIYVPAPPRPEEAAVLQGEGAGGQQQQMTQAEQEEEEQLMAKGWFAAFEAGGGVRDDAAEAHRAGVKRNFSAVHTAARALGRVPEMLSATDFLEHGPDEKAVILYVAFLCTRLLEVSREDRAAAVLQRAWRQRQARTVGTARAHLATWVAAATVVQRAVRTWRFRRAWAQMRREQMRFVAAITQLQAAWRARPAHRQYTRQRAGAVLIQREWRRHRAAVLDEQRRQAELYRAVIVAQSSRRAAVQRRVFCQLKHAAVACQALIRMSRAQLQLRRCREAAIVLQQAYRSHRRRRQQQERHRAAIVLQSAWRMRTTRREFLQQRRAAVVLQSAARGSSCRRSFARQRAAAVALQSHWRGLSVRRRLQVLGYCCSVIQSSWRGHRQRRLYLGQLRGAVQLQAAVRGWLARRQLSELQRNAAATVLQSSWRARQARLLLRNHRAAVRIQSAWRGAVARRELQLHHRSATAIQAAWRAHVATRRYQQLRCHVITLQSHVRRQRAIRYLHQTKAAAVVLQSLWRARQARGTLQQHRAAVVIQSGWRGYSARAAVARQHRAATVVQSAWRAATARRKFRGVQDDVVLIQKLWRGYSARQTFLRSKTAAVALQSAWRGHAVRRGMQRERAAAVLVQARWRGYSQLRRYRKTRRSLIMLQAAARRIIEQRRYAASRAAVVRIQAAWRGHSQRAAYSAAKQAATTLQAAWRARVAQQSFQRLRSAATCIQAYARMVAARRRYLQQRHAAVCLQAAWRGQSARMELQRQQGAATAIQAAWRGAVARRRYRRQHAAALQIQSLWRMQLARRSYSQQRSAAVCMQSHWRRRQVQVQHRRTVAAIVLQKHVRGHQTRAALLRQHQAATAMQTAWRGHRQQQLFLAARRAAIVIQREARRRQQQLRYQRTKRATITLQSHWRRRQTVLQLQQQRQAAARIQATWRMRQQRREYQRQVAVITRVQALARMAPLRRQFCAQRAAAITIQKAVRMQQAVALRRRVKAAVVMQSFIRGWSARLYLVRLYVATLTIQRFARGMAARRQVANMRAMRAAVAAFEAAAREYVIRYRAATLIQSMWKGHVARAAFAPTWTAWQYTKRQQAAARCIQQAWHAHTALRERQRRQAAQLVISRCVPMLRDRLAFLRLRRAAVVLQRAWRRRMAGRDHALLVIQSTVRMWLARRRTRAAIAGVRRVQALWRGYQQRKRVGRTVKEARRKLRAAAEASERAPHKRIGVRAKEALEVLLARKELTQVTTAVAAMEFSTRYSRACSELIATNGGLTALLRFMRTCNRSKPHVDMLRHALAMLNNICRYDELLPYVLEAEDAVQILTERLQFFRDTEDVFLSTVSILHRLVEAESHAELVARTPNLVKQLEGIGQIIMRKIEMERKYIARLEGQKGSDVTAREATRKLVSAAKQLESLEAVLSRVQWVAESRGIRVAHTETKSAWLDCNDTSVPAGSEAAHTGGWLPKNTIVRDVMREIASGRLQVQQQHHQQQAQVSMPANGVQQKQQAQQRHDHPKIPGGHPLRTSVSSSGSGRS